MCDDTTETENEVYLETAKLKRRELNLGAGAALVMMLSGCASSSNPKEPEPAPSSAKAAPDKAAPPPTTGQMVTISTPDGSAEAFFITPNEGTHPGVLLWPDVAGLRDAYTSMAARLAQAGYAVLAVNPYYRSAKMPVLASFAEWRTDAGKEKIRPLRDALTVEAISRDGAAFTAWLDQQKQVDKNKKLASMGYCMSGPFTFRTAAAAPERVGAIASFHGGGLATKEATSPHLLFAKIKAAALICIAQNDDERDPDAKTTLRQAADAAHLAAEIEVYPAQHGFCALDSPVYDAAQAERAWTRMLALFGKYL